MIIFYFLYYKIDNMKGKRYLEYGSATLQVPPKMIGYDKQHQPHLYKTLTKEGFLSHHGKKSAIKLLTIDKGNKIKAIKGSINKLDNSKKRVRKTVQNLKTSMDKANKAIKNIQYNKDDLNDLKTKLTASVTANDMLNDLFPTAVNSIPPRRRGRKPISIETINARNEAKKAAKEAKTLEREAKKQQKIAEKEAKLAEKEAKKLAKEAKKKSSIGKRGRPKKMMV